MASLSFTNQRDLARDRRQHIVQQIHGDFLDKQCFVICCMSSAISMHCYFSERNTAKGGLVCTVQSCVSMEYCRSGQVYTTFTHTTATLTSVTVQVRMDAIQCRERTRVQSERM